MGTYMATLSNSWTPRCLFGALVLIVLNLPHRGYGQDELSKIQEILTGRRIQCPAKTSNSLMPHLNFEVANPKVEIPKDQSILQIKMDLVYYRCPSDPNTETPPNVPYMIVDPESSYEYTVSQLDETKTKIKVKKHQPRFMAMLTGAKSEKTGVRGSTVRLQEFSEPVFRYQFDLDLNAVLTPERREQMKTGRALRLPVRILNSISTEYRVNDEINDTSESQEGTTLTVILSFSMTSNKSAIKTEIVKIGSSRL